MTILACILTIMVSGQPKTVAATGDYLGEQTGVYRGNFSHALGAAYANILVDKSDCILQTKAGL